jgi:hypothetical protein
MAPDKMKWIPAAYVEEGNVLMRKSQLFRVVKVEHPHAIIRRFAGGEFGPREIIELEGEYFKPSESFLVESGIYKGRGREPEASPRLLKMKPEGETDPVSNLVIDFGASVDGASVDGASADAKPQEGAGPPAASAEERGALFTQSLDDCDFEAFAPAQELDEIDRLEEFRECRSRGR